jgi:acetyl-CoA synthetase
MSLTERGTAANLVDYERARGGFSWEEERAALEGELGPNIAQAAITRQINLGRGQQVALRWLGRRGERVELTYAQLEAETSRFANVLAALGVQPGERVCSLAGRIPELYVAALGTLKHRAVFCPLFSAFGPEPIRTRVLRSDARVLVTTEALYQRKVAPMRASLTGLRHVLAVGRGGPVRSEGVWDLRALMADASTDYTPGPTDREHMALLHFTSGTTGAPKGAVHVHAAGVVHHVTGRDALDIHPGDVYWCTADPGWVTGASYGIIAPLTCGATLVIDEAEFDAARWYQILQDERVQVWYTAPTAIRMLMRLGPEVAARYDLSALRFVASVGEPLNPGAVIWGQEVLGLPIRDNWWQTETGGIVVANYATAEVRPGSMGRPGPGFDVAIVRRIGEDELEILGEPGEEGELAIRAGWPSMFRGYLGDEARYAACFREGWYLSGDLARRDEGGWLWFVGRADDVIKSAGHLVGPFEVESALMAHPAVAEVGVIGRPDEVAGAIIKAFVALKPGAVGDEALRLELLGFARARLGPAVAPREIDFVDHLPHTRSGKIMRRLLKARELGLPEGDTSTLEGAP